MARHVDCDSVRVLKRCVLLGLAISTGSASQITAQGVAVKPEGIICQTPRCDVRRSLPISVLGPLEYNDELVQLVQNTSASSLDASLPLMPFFAWLQATLEPRLGAGGPGVVTWSLGFCDDRRSAIPRAGPDLCVDASARLGETLSVMISVGVAHGQSALDGTTRWRLHDPVLHDAFLERHNQNLSQVDSLDIGALGDLAARIDQQDDKWPTVDLKTAVTWTPARWRPGDVVTFTIWVENVGKRDADRAAVSVLLGVAQDERSTEIRREWFPRVKANERIGFEVSTPLPRGDALIHVSAQPGPGRKRMTDANPDNNDTTLVVGVDGQKPAPRRPSVTP